MAGPVSQYHGRLDEIIAMLVEGMSYREIVAKIGGDLHSLHDFLSKPENRAKYRTAMEFSARTFDDKAEEVVKNARGTKEELMRAKELAHHYRWRSSKRNVKEYGDKVDLTTAGDKITPTTLTVTIIKPDEH
jgi:hypothetical protein